MIAPYFFELSHDAEGRIVGKTETLPRKTLEWTYVYDGKGRLSEAKLDGRRICACWYDRQGRRLEDHFPFRTDHTYSRYAYSMDNRLQSAGNNGYTHDENGFRLLWNKAGQYTRYAYSSDYRLLRAEEEGAGRVFEFTHDEGGQREAKYLNGQLVEAYSWLDFVRLGGFHDGRNGYEFVYEEETRTPFAMRRDDGAAAYLFYDQVGSLRVVSDAEGRILKEVLYDPFGGVIEDTNPGLAIPIGFAGGLHDRDLGFVRFGWRDYDVFTSRWTAPDPIGDAGGDDDWYGYCLDDPVNLEDPMGLFALNAAGAIIGGVANACSSFGAYNKGEITRVEYAAAIAAGAGLGAINPGASVLRAFGIGAVTSGLNSVAQQAIVDKKVDAKEVVQDAFMGAASARFSDVTSMMTGKITATGIAKNKWTGNVVNAVTTAGNFAAKEHALQNNTAQQTNASSLGGDQDESELGVGSPSVQSHYASINKRRQAARDAMRQREQARKDKEAAEAKARAEAEAAKQAKAAEQAEAKRELQRAAQQSQLNGKKSSGGGKQDNNDYDNDWGSRGENRQRNGSSYNKYGGADRYGGPDASKRGGGGFWGR